MALRLIIEDEEGATTIVPLGEEEITIGREPGNTIQLTEQNVSRQHARLTPGSDGWLIEDLDSYNGVRVNGVLIEGSVNLNEGDVVQIGDYHLAITNNAEQTTLNFDRPGQAANSEPTRAAPSVDLPRIPAAEAVLLTANGSMSGAVGGPDVEPGSEQGEGGKGRGLVVLLVLLLTLGGGFAAFQFIKSNRAETKGPPATSEGPAANTPRTPPPEIKAEPPPPETKTPTPPPETKTPPPSENDVDGYPPEPPPDEDDTPPEPTKKTPTPPLKTDKAPVKKVDKVEKPEAPKGDPAQLLEDARKANLAGNATQAYELAKKSYEIDRNVNALALMGASACKMGDATKAKSSFKKLSDENRKKQMIMVCAERGITLE